MATHSSTLAWRIPWTKEPGRLQSMGSQRVGHDWVTSLSLSLSSIQISMCLVAQSCPTLCNPVDCNLPGSPSMGFSRQEYWSGSPFPSPGDLSNPGIKPGSPAFQADALTSEPPGNQYINWQSIFINYFVHSLLSKVLFEVFE